MRRPTSTFALALSCAYTVNAFVGTYPILAWSDQPLESLSSILLASPSDASTPLRPGATSTEQQTFASDSSDLCSLDSLLVVSVPGLHFSDLARLPLAASSPSGVSAALAHSETKATVPFVRQHTLSTPLKLVRQFERECGAVFGGNRKDERHAKTIRIVQLDGMDGFELDARGADAGRRTVMENVDAAVAYNLGRLSSPHAVVLTSLPASYSSPRRLNTKRPHLDAANRAREKRQLLEPEIESTSDLPEEEQEFIEEVLEEIEEEQAFDDMMSRVKAHDGEDATALPKSDIGVSEIVTPEDLISEEEEAVENQEEGGQEEEWDGEPLRISPYYSEYDSYAKGSKNRTSIFEPKEKSGLLHRYVFFTPALVFALLVTLMVLIPTVLIAVQALTSIETLQGLENKMTGSVGIDPSKA